MLNISLAGNLGRDAEHKTTQGGQELCSFAVSVNVGFGENKSTVWVDVTRWGKGAEGLARILRKGSKVAVCGELSTRDHNGKTYLQCRADNVTIQGTPEPATGERKRGYDDPPARQSAGGGGGWAGDDLDDHIPFITRNSIW